MVALRPSSKPASARMNAPLQIEATRRDLFEALRTNASTPEVAGRTSTRPWTSSMLPQTITVSNTELPRRFVSMDRPSELGTDPPASDRT